MRIACLREPELGGPIDCGTPQVELGFALFVADCVYARPGRCEMFRTSRGIPVVADVVLAQSVSRSIVADLFLAWCIRCDTRHRCLELAPELVAASLEPNSEDQNS